MEMNLKRQTPDEFMELVVKEVIRLIDKSNESAPLVHEIREISEKSLVVLEKYRKVARNDIEKQEPDFDIDEKITELLNEFIRIFKKMKRLDKNSPEFQEHMNKLDQLSEQSIKYLQMQKMIEKTE